MDRDVALKELLELIRRNCKMGCEAMCYLCRKAGFDCFSGCDERHCICTNRSAVDISEDN